MNDELIQLYRDYNVAMAADDVERLSQLLAPTFTLTHMTGFKQPRQDWLNEIAAGTMTYFSSTEDHVDVKQTADGATIVGQNRVVASIHGSRQTEWPLQTQMQVTKSNNQWQIMNAVVTTY